MHAITPCTCFCANNFFLLNMLPYRSTSDLEHSTFCHIFSSISESSCHINNYRTVGAGPAVRWPPDQSLAKTGRKAHDASMERTHPGECSKQRMCSK